MKQNGKVAMWQNDPATARQSSLRSLQRGNSARVVRISGPVVGAIGLERARLFDVVRVGEIGLVGEIIVVDNCSTDGSAEVIESEFPTVTLIKNASNLGYAKAVNQGIGQSTGKYFLILNPDIETIHAHNATRGCFSAKIERN